MTAVTVPVSLHKIRSHSLGNSIDVPAEPLPGVMDKLSVGGSTTHSQHCGSMNGGSVLVQLSVRVIPKSTFNVDETKDGA